ncbi:hypothetical protein [Mesobacillus zeae]|uniref:Nuclear transport factor 2 family protein n=1 Tax=Mesobacillus zeae TaxID=1917180 RepID=A0A398B9T6_9BACI|nr:hypothetical protein [Mesobacillus zeae]RID86745.1 hypothetical protein D1970_05675 [Mesobacillus zeae]
MKKLVMLATALGLLLTGCGSDEEKAAKPAKEETAAKTEVKKEEAKPEAAKEASSSENSDAEESIKKDLLESMKYAEEENMDQYLDTLLISPEDKELTKTQMGPIFEKTELEYKLESMKVLESSADSAKVEVVQTTVAKEVTDNFQFKDNRVTGIHTMKLDNGKWKTAGTEVKNVEYME